MLALAHTDNCFYGHLVKNSNTSDRYLHTL